MALNVGPDFKQRWLKAPEAVRQAYLDDLQRIYDVLKPETSLDDWIAYDEKQQQYSLEKIDVAYAELKAQLIEEAKIRHQKALEKKLADKRAEQEAYAAQLQKDEELKFAKETERLAQLRQNLDQEIHQYASRYTRNPEKIESHFNKAALTANLDIHSDLENLKIRLELEADLLIDQAITVLRAKLHAAAQEEIEYILKNSNLPTEDHH